MMLMTLVELRMAMVIGGANFASMQSPVEFQMEKSRKSEGCWLCVLKVPLGSDVVRTRKV